MAAGSTQGGNVALLGPPDESIGVNRHAANRAIAHDRYNANDKCLLGDLANAGPKLCDCVIATNKCNGHEEVNDRLYSMARHLESSCPRFYPTYRPEPSSHNRPTCSCSPVVTNRSSFSSVGGASCGAPARG